MRYQASVKHHVQHLRVHRPSSIVHRRSIKEQTYENQACATDEPLAGAGAARVDRAGSLWRRPGHAPRRRPAARSRSASCTSGRPTTMATTTRPTRAGCTSRRQLGDKVETLTAENVPEDANAERVMEQMINNGATIIFPTSYGHFNPAVNESKKHPDIDFWHQGGLAPEANVGSYFGEIWQMVYASGVAAGKMTKTNKLGYIVAFPIPQVLENINAFQLGAKSVNPDADHDRGVYRQLVRPGQEQRGRQQPDRPGRRRADAAPGLPQAGDRDGREARGHVGRLPRRRQPGRAEGLAHRRRCGTGGRSTPSWPSRRWTASSSPSCCASASRMAWSTWRRSAPACRRMSRSWSPRSSRTSSTARSCRSRGRSRTRTARCVIEGEQPDTITLEKMDYLVEGVIGTIPK